jgi:hypothetical protein
MIRTEVALPHNLRREGTQSKGSIAPSKRERRCSRTTPMPEGRGFGFLEVFLNPPSCRDTPFETASGGVVRRIPGGRLVT